jgi:D-serine deaminase-like pyridoxal phosphate-dependent protein
VGVNVGRAADQERYEAATRELEPPFAIVDLEALRGNAENLARRAGGKPVRLASKSVRCRAVIERVLRLDGYRGILAYTLPEALWLARNGSSDDIVVAYPTANRAALAIRYMQKRSAAELAVRRAAVVRAVRAVADLEFVNGGGTGSAAGTSAEAAVTEIGAGSGLYHPALFDGYRSFTGRPAALYALPVVRRPGPGVVTALCGGYAASGGAGPSRLPRPYLPAGLRLDREEGAGEVQTPLLGAEADRLRIGDRVWMRHAKAGELCERFNELHLVEGDRIVATVPTYRGEGQAFG